MKCPHCLVDFNDQQTWWSAFLGRDSQDAWLLVRRRCPTCNQFIFNLDNGQGPIAADGQTNVRLNATKTSTMVVPRGISRAPVPSEVPPQIAEDYKEACLVLTDSAKASAALSRRCLQNLLRLAAGVKPGDLSGEIQQVLDSGKLPSDTADNIDAIRNIGNFAAHPNKSKSTGDIVAVEPHEAEWNLEVLESLFDFYFVEPARAKARRDALNKKLIDAGKPPLK
jgi:hypothetical protein